jgi:hypothetical protein
VIYHTDKTSPKAFDQAEPELLTGPAGRGSGRTGATS